MNGLPDRPLAKERELTELLGGPQSEALYPTGWGQMCNTPFPTYKTYTGGGGRRVTYIISWPAKIQDRGQIRSQFIHVTDVMPTLLDLAGLKTLDTINGVPALPLHGKSFAPVLFDAAAPSPRTEQYYECWSNRAYYRDGWLARSLQKRGMPIDMDNWTLHNLHEDFSESVDMRDQYPEKLHELVEAFDQAAWLNMVYPLDNRAMLQKLSDRAPESQPTGPRTFKPGGQTIHGGLIVPLIANRNFRMRVRFSCQAATRAFSGPSASRSVAWCSTLRMERCTSITMVSASTAPSLRCRWQRETMRRCWTTRPPASARAAGASSWTAGCHRLGQPLADAHGRVPRRARHWTRPPLPGELAALREAPLIPVYRHDRGRDHRAG